MLEKAGIFNFGTIGDGCLELYDLSEFPRMIGIDDGNCTADDVAVPLFIAPGMCDLACTHDDGGYRRRKLDKYARPRRNFHEMGTNFYGRGVVPV